MGFSMMASPGKVYVPAYATMLSYKATFSCDALPALLI
jgi:hypothetical protein